ncbi:FAD-binding oxidoreductase [Sphaerisporangium sp. NPDC049002]|uniref:FAD-binding oxidoreductase n=1 Tax=unclassified Sphaerisporangium TaxID=2630420 RepID=UPI0033E75F01
MTSHDTGLRTGGYGTQAGMESGQAKELRGAVRGRVSVPGDEGFETAKQAWNLTVDQPVSAVVEVENAADAAEVVRFAVRNGFGVAVQPSGHGASDGLDGEILVRTGRLDGVQVWPERRLARVEAGASWGAVLAEAGKHGLTGLAGSSPVVSATGYTLGGGLSWFSRRHGFAANSVRAFDVIDAHGVARRVTDESDAELFWALRGGGGDFALVTAMEFELFPAPELYGGRVIWPAERAADVLAAFRDVTAEAPEELSVWFALMQFPPFPELPEPLRGLSAVVVDVTFLGDGAEARALLQRFDRIPGVIVDTRGEVAPRDLGGICAEPTSPSPSMMRAELFGRFDDTTAAAFLSATAPGAGMPLTSVQIRHLGGALSRLAPDAGACGYVREPYLVSALGITPTPEAVRAVRARQNELRLALARHTTGIKPFNFLAHEENSASAYPGDVLARLRGAKRHHDPLGVFRSNHPVLA